MGQARRRTAFCTLAVLVAVLLPAGVLAAVSLDRPPATVDGAAAGQVGATGLGVQGVDDEQAAGLSTGVTVVAPSPAGAAPTVPAPSPPVPGRTAPATTTTKPAAPSPTPVTGATLPPGAPLPNMPPATGIPDIEPASSWFTSHNGITVRVRMEPAAPVAGQVVRFFVDVSTTQPCCAFAMQFGDGSSYTPNGLGGCAAPAPASIVVTHTFANPGAYKGGVSVAPFPCQSVNPGGGGPSVLIAFDGAAITTCVGIGPGPVAQKGCSPFPDFGPDTLVSPVIDPFCQVRSDCTKASTPR